MTSTNAILTMHAQSIPSVKIPLAVTHVTATMASRKFMTDVLILMNVFLPVVTSMLHVKMHQVLSRVLVEMVMKVMVFFAKILTNILPISVLRNPNVSIIKVLTHANANPDTPWIATTCVSMSMNVLLEHLVISNHHYA